MKDTKVDFQYMQTDNVHVPHLKTSYMYKEKTTPNLAI